MTITTRTSKGSALTYAEMDSNLSSLDSDRTSLIASTNSLDSDRTVLITAKNNFMIDMWRLHTNFDTNDATITGWERPDNATFGRIGTGMTESSGVFTFPSTGVYLVTTHFRVGIVGGADATVGYQIQVSSNSLASSDSVATAYEGNQTSSTVNANACIQALINVTNASTFRVFTKTASLANTSRINGNSSENQSIITFERKGDAQ